jgi:23S rRNA (adenine1618-N6)-methyltransferase
MLASASLKQRQPFTACTGSESEMVTPGGEVAFVSRMITESLQLRERVRWYSSMLGIFASVSKVVERLKEEGIQNFAVTEFVQGRKTRRWGVAWSFGDWRPRMEVARGVAGLSRALLPFPCEYYVMVRLLLVTGHIRNANFWIAWERG